MFTKGENMFEYSYGEKLSNERMVYYRDILIKKFAREYDIKTNRLWNCLREKSTCFEFEIARKLNVPSSVLLYLERHNEVYKTTFKNVCRYVDELEPWEYIDAYVFDETFTWIFAITHEDLKCLIIGLKI